MDPLTIGLLGGAALGLGKSYLVDKPQEKKDRMVAAETARWSPWTHMQPEAVKRANPFGDALQFGSTGAQMGQGMQNQQMYNGYLQNQTGSMPSTAQPGFNFMGQESGFGGGPMTKTDAFGRVIR